MAIKTAGVSCQQVSSLDLTAPLFETITEVSAARTFSQPKDNICERDDVVVSAEASSEVPSVVFTKVLANISAPPPDVVCEPAYVGSAEFEVDQQVRRVDTVKTDKCLKCHVTVKRIGRHLEQHRDTICERSASSMTFTGRGMPPKALKYTTASIVRRFVSVVIHWYKAKCDCTKRRSSWKLREQKVSWVLK